MGRRPGTAEQQAVARQIATVPMRLGGLGLRSARRMAPAALWASWADAMPMLSERLPNLTDQVKSRMPLSQRTDRVHFSS